ncbi:hypothetical protein EP18_08245 [Lysinibacillus sphaericus]|nr:hypothetical protein EP18_08245 [Lysinibacillus sphaericus]
MFMTAIWVTFFFGSFSYIMLKYPHDVLKVSPFSRGFAESPLLKFYIQFVGWVFVLLIIGVWTDAFIQWQLL